MHGGLSLVVPVRKGDEPYILKIGWADKTTAYEALALTAWNGNGVVRLLAAQPEQGAMLLERLDSRRSLNDVDIETAISVAGHLLRRLAIPAPDEVPRLQDVAQRLAETLPERWEQLNRPLSRQQLDQARSLAIELGHSADGLLVNYGLIYADVLAGIREPWLAVDPKVASGDLEYGVAQLLWRRLEEKQTQRGQDYYFQRLTDVAGIDPERARSWTYVRCVDYWLWGVSIGLTEDPARCTAIIDWLT